MTSARHRILLATVSYADVFDYPLTRAEARLWGMGTIGSFASEDIERVGEYLVLPGRRRIVALRRTRQQIAVAKWKRARKVARMFRMIPTVTLVGVTGGLAMDNAREGDDIDLFFITRGGTLWITRMLATLLGEFTGVRRRPHERQVSDKVCLNMFMAEDALCLPRVEHDLFAAHEVLQMVPIWERGGAYEKFLGANTWVRDFLPNAWRERMKSEQTTQKSEAKGFLLSVFYFVFRLLEPIARSLQLWYMESKRTNEVIRSGLIRFHPQDARVWVREKYARRLKRWDIPLDKFFYHR